MLTRRDIISLNEIKLKATSFELQNTKTTGAEIFFQITLKSSPRHITRVFFFLFANYRHCFKQSSIQIATVTHTFKRLQVDNAHLVQ